MKKKTKKQRQVVYKSPFLLSYEKFENNYPNLSKILKNLKIEFFCF